MEDVKLAKLGDGNYSSWSTQMEFVFMSKDLLSVVTEGISNQASETAADRLKDSQARALIGLSVETQHLGIVKAAATAKAAWEALKDLFAASSNARKLTLVEQLSQIRKQPAESITL